MFFVNNLLSDYQRLKNLVIVTKRLLADTRMAPPRHMTSADPYPRNTPGLLRLYYMQYCPYALRARLMLTLKGISFETININLRDKPAWYLQKFPPGTVPVIEVDDKLLGESLVIAEYIDEVYSEPGEPIIPSDPYERAKERLLINNFFPKVIAAVYQRLRKEDNWRDAFYKQFTEVEKILGQRKFFSGNKLGYRYSDYMIWPWMRYFGPHIIDDVLPGGEFPNIERWLGDMKSDDDIVQKCHTRPEILARFTKGYPTREFEYDIE